MMVKTLVGIGACESVKEILTGYRPDDTSIHRVWIVDECPLWDCRREACLPFLSEAGRKRPSLSEIEAQADAAGLILMPNKKIHRINLKRRTLIFEEDKERMDWDALIVGQMPRKNFSVPMGHQREGVTSLSRPADLMRLAKRLTLIETVVVVPESFWALKVALALAERGREVILCFPAGESLDLRLGPAVAEALSAKWAEAGVRLITGNPVTEILGDKEVKAVRLQNGKVIGCEAVLISEKEADLRLFKDQISVENGRIAADDFFRGPMEGLRAVEGCAGRPETVGAAYEDFSDAWREVMVHRVLASLAETTESPAEPWPWRQARLCFQDATVSLGQTPEPWSAVKDWPQQTFEADGGRRVTVWGDPERGVHRVTAFHEERLNECLDRRTADPWPWPDFWQTLGEGYRPLSKEGPVSDSPAADEMIEEPAN